jgi:hypothetical protein
MSVEDDFRRVVQILRDWGFNIREEPGCYGRSNGSGWAAGRPVGHINHHYVCSLNPDQGYIDNLVANIAAGDVVNWFADVHGVAYLVGTGPMNHAGTGNSSVLNLTRADQPPPSFPASAAGDIGGNPHYAGTECQHPGDSTPWPGPMLDTMVAINAAEALVFGWTAARAINHAEWTNRKIDMSAGGGVNSGGWAGDELRRRVAARMTGQLPKDIPMPLIVKRANGTDYGWTDDLGFYLRIPSVDYYANLSAVIELPPHGQADPVDQALVDWYRGQVAAAGGRIFEPAQ